MPTALGGYGWQRAGLGHNDNIFNGNRPHSLGVFMSVQNVIILMFGVFCVFILANWLNRKK